MKKPISTPKVRKHLTGTPRKVFGARLTQKQIEFIKSRGGVSYLSDLLDAEIVKSAFVGSSNEQR